MIETARGRSMRLLAAVLLALTTVVVGFAHRAPRLEPRGYPTDFAAWVLPDGTLPALCHADDLGGAPHDRDDGTSGCDACRLADAPGLVVAMGTSPPAPPALVLARLGHGTAALAGSLLPAPLSRGPPVVG
jgi:hypothetical protein